MAWDDRSKVCFLIGALKGLKTRYSDEDKKAIDDILKMVGAEEIIREAYGINAEIKVEIPKKKK